jgi:hypothetical protein
MDLLCRYCRTRWTPIVQLIFSTRPRVRSVGPRCRALRLAPSPRVCAERETTLSCPQSLLPPYLRTVVMKAVGGGTDDKRAMAQAIRGWVSEYVSFFHTRRNDKFNK